MNIELNAVPHPTDQLIVCQECGESYAAFSSIEQAADWVENHVRDHHGGGASA